MSQLFSKFNPKHLHIHDKICSFNFSLTYSLQVQINYNML